MTLQTIRNICTECCGKKGDEFEKHMEKTGCVFADEVYDIFLSSGQIIQNAYNHGCSGATLNELVIEFGTNDPETDPCYKHIYVNAIDIIALCERR